MDRKEGNYLFMNLHETPWGKQHKITRLWEKITKQKGFLPENSVNGIPAQEFMEGWLELPAYACLDHFPRRVPAETDYLYFEGWEQHMLHSHRLEIQAKFLRILCKMACFFPYSHFLLDGFFFLPGKGKKAVDGEILCTDVFPYLPLDKLWECVRKMEKIRKEQERGPYYHGPKFCFYFPKPEVMIYFASDDIYGILTAKQEPPQEFVDLLRQFTEAEGLFLRGLEQEGEEA